MTCADDLLTDHDDITAMLRVLAASAARLQQRRYVDPAMLAGLDRFLQQFVDDCHFRKEDTVFFPYVRAVLPDEAARTHACSALHAQCRVSMQELHAVLERVQAEDMEGIVGGLTLASPGCIDRLMAHIEAERPLLDGVRRRPPDGKDEELLRACAELERRHLGATGREWYAQLVSDYADIARSWSSWPATIGAPHLDSGHSSSHSRRGRTAPRGRGEGP